MKRLPSGIVPNTKRESRTSHRGQTASGATGGKREQERRWFVDGALPVRTNPNSCVVNLSDTASARLVTEAVMANRGGVTCVCVCMGGGALRGQLQGPKPSITRLRLTQLLLTVRCRRTNLLIDSAVPKGSCRGYFLTSCLDEIRRS